MNGIFNILTVPKPTADICAAYGAKYAVIHAGLGRRGVDWESIFHLAGRYANRVLLPQGWEPPADSGISPPVLRRFEEMVLLHTACEAVARTRMPMYRRVVGILDRRGLYGDMLEELLKYYTTAKVYTENTAYYRQVSRRMMEEYGAPVQLCELPEGLLDCVLVLAPEGVDGLEDLRCRGPVLTGEAAPARFTAFRCVNRLRLTPPPATLELIPQGICPHQFAGALYEFCGVDMAGFVAGRALLDGAQIELDRLTDLMGAHTV